MKTIHTYAVPRDACDEAWFRWCRRAPDRSVEYKAYCHAFIHGFLTGKNVTDFDHNFGVLLPERKDDE